MLNSSEYEKYSYVLILYTWRKSHSFHEGEKLNYDLVPAFKKDTNYYSFLSTHLKDDLSNQQYTKWTQRRKANSKPAEAKILCYLKQQIKHNLFIYLHPLMDEKCEVKTLGKGK